MGLGHIRHQLGQLRGIQLADIPPRRLNLSGVPGKQTQHTPEQSAFTYTIWSQKAQERGLLQAKRDVMQHLLAAVRKPEPVHLNAHPLLPPFFRIRLRKKGAPINAVRMPMGISLVHTFRETLSTVRRKIAPVSIAAGSRRL
ncbi:hypothetical protein D3C75_871250 [compost metagenome]